MPSVAELRSTVERYVELVGSGTAEQVAECYTADAVLEDPAGSEPKRGRAAIVEFYKVIEPIQRSTELLWCRVGGDTAVFEFRIVTVFGDTTVELQPVDVMRFDAAGLITSMRAVWSAEDMIQRPTT